MTAESFKSVLNLHFHNIPSDVDKTKNTTSHFYLFISIDLFLHMIVYFFFVSNFGDFTGLRVASGPSPDHDVTDSTLYLLS
jgi:hypothetical protein